MRRVLDDPPSYLRKAVGLDGRLWGILMTALRKDPLERTPSALALREALAGWLDARGIALPRAIPPSLVSPPSKTTPLDPTLVGPEPSSALAPLTPQLDDAPPSFDGLIRAKLSR